MNDDELEKECVVGIPRREEKKVTPIEALHEACARNSPLEIVQADLAGIEPFARGRMLEIEDGVIVIEQVQLIGKVVRFTKQTPLLAYFRYDKKLYEFNSVVLSSTKSVKLSQSLVVPAMDIKFPTKVQQGQRRNVYRIPLAAMKEPIAVEFWEGKPPAAESCDGANSSQEGGESESGEIIVPSRKPEWVGTMVDASDVGFGINIEGCKLKGIKKYSECWVRFDIQDDNAESFTFRVESRQVRSVREGVIRVGLLILEGKDRWAHAAKIKRLWSFLTVWQRKVCRTADPDSNGQA